MISECFYGTNLDGSKSLFFIFPELCIRIEGTYRLKFSLHDLSTIREKGHSALVAVQLSDPFTSYSAKDFPGMSSSSALSIHLAEQGLKIPVRHKPRKRLTAIGTTSLRGKASSKRRRGSSSKSGTRLKRVVEEEDGDENDDNDEDNEDNENVQEEN